MWNPGTDRKTVVCIACGTSLLRTEAREYDKEGDRWNREDKTFEHLCKPCDRRRSHQPRRGLEETLVACDAGEIDREVFLSAFCSAVQEPRLDDP